MGMINSIFRNLTIVKIDRENILEHCEINSYFKEISIVKPILALGALGGSFIWGGQRLATISLAAYGALELTNQLYTLYKCYKKSEETDMKINISQNGTTVEFDDNMKMKSFSDKSTSWGMTDIFDKEYFKSLFESFFSYLK